MSMEGKNSLVAYADGTGMHLLSLFMLWMALLISADDKLSSTNICENTSKDIGCPKGQVIHVRYANYGRYVKEICPHSGSPQNSLITSCCASKGSVARVGQMCNGKSSCRLFASSNIFGDPCRGTYKYLRVVFECRAGKPHSTTGLTAGRPVQLTGNIALRKPTAQSSTGPWGGIASRGNDGNSNPNWHGRSCTHTYRQPNPWWRVDLGNSYRVSQVKITNRGDCCWNRLRAVEVDVGMTAASPAGNQRCAYFPGAFGRSETKTLTCTQPVQGRYVFVTLKITEYLTLCEVQVFAVGAGRSAATTRLTGNIALRKPTAQSSTGPWGGVASRGNDGNSNPNWHGRSCTHTYRQPNPWWRVDLGNSYRVNQVKITNRGDCCWNRLRAVEVDVGMRAASPAGNQRCAYFPGAFGRSETKTLTCTQPVQGRYVFVTLKITEYLTLCEVQVFAIAG